MVKIKSNSLYQIIIITYILNLFLCLDEKEDMKKAISCLTLLSQKKIEGEPDRKKYQSM